MGLSCASNERNYGRHIWDRLDAEGCIGAMASVVVPWFADLYADGADWRAMAGGSTTISPIASCSSFRNSRRSTSAGANGRDGA